MTPVVQVGLVGADKSVRKLWDEGGQAAYHEQGSDLMVDALRDDVVLAAPADVVLDPEAPSADTEDVASLGPDQIAHYRAGP
jgi:hypothetical protein